LKEREIETVLDLNFDNAGETTWGPRAVAIILRRGLCKLLRPVFVRLAENFQSVVDRLDRLETSLWHAHKTSEGLAAHISRLGDDHRGLDARFRAEVADQVAHQAAQFKELGHSFGALAERQDQVDEKVHAFQALHWDHVALARRLAMIEDLLAVPSDGSGTVAVDGEHRRSIPFPGLDEKARSRVV
jgi:hypothetical protein